MVQMILSSSKTTENTLSPANGKRVAVGVERQSSLPRFQDSGFVDPITGNCAIPPRACCSMVLAM